GMAVPGATNRDRSPASVSHDDLRRVDGLDGRLDDDRGGAAADRLRHEPVPVGLRAAHRHVDLARPHRSAVARDTGDSRCAAAGRDEEARALELIQQLAPGGPYQGAAVQTVTVAPGASPSP